MALEKPFRAKNIVPGNEFNLNAGKCKTCGAQLSYDLPELVPKENLGMEDEAEIMPREFLALGFAIRDH